MGKRLRQQRRGKGGPSFEAKHKGIKASYNNLSEKQANEKITGQVLDLIKDSGRSSILAMISFEDGSTNYIVAAEGISV